MRLKDGQISLSSSKDKQAYRKLRRLLDKSLDLSGDYWNWPTVGYLTLPTMQRILNLAWIYDLQIKSSGCIMEFGLHYGSSFAQLINLRSILEPYNYSRHIYGFDTFEGTPNPTKEDITKYNELMKDEYERLKKKDNTSGWNNASMDVVKNNYHNNTINNNVNFLVHEKILLILIIASSFHPTYSKIKIFESLKVITGI